MTTRILVTGSEGFLGKHLRHALRARGCIVLGIDRPGTGAEHEIDLSDPSLSAAQLAEQIGPVEGIIYLAANILRTSSVDDAARRNLQTIAAAAVDLMDAWNARHGLTHFVYCSTFKTYGPALQLPIDPERPPQRPDPFSYGSAKLLAERLLAVSAARTGARYAIVRSSCITGPGQHLHNAIPVFLRDCWQGQRPIVFGTGTALRDDVLAPDLADCLAEACLRKAEGPFHGSGECARTIYEVARLCCQAVAALGGPQGLEPVIDGSRPAKWWLDQSFDITRTRTLLDYEPTPLLQGLQWEAAWIREGAQAQRALDYCPPPRVRKELP